MEGVPGEGRVRVDALVGALRVDDPRALLTPGCTARALRTIRIASIHFRAASAALYEPPFRVSQQSCRCARRLQKRLHGILAQ